MAVSGPLKWLLSVVERIAIASILRRIVIASDIWSLEGGPPCPWHPLPADSKQHYKLTPRHTHGGELVE